MEKTSITTLRIRTIGTEDLESLWLNCWQDIKLIQRTTKPTEPTRSSITVLTNKTEKISKESTSKSSSDLPRPDSRFSPEQKSLESYEDALLKISC